MNTAVALTRLGSETQFLGRMGNDSFATQLKNHLRENQVGLDLLVEAEAPTSLAAVSLDSEGKAVYTFHFDGTSNFGWRSDEFPELQEDDWLHFGSIAAVCEPGASAIWEFARTTKASLSYDINVRPSVQPDVDRYLRDVKEIIKIVGASGGIVKASDEDLELLLDKGADHLAIARGWLAEYGLAMLLITLGADGAVALLADGGEVRVPGYHIELADTVGAGDTFMAGFLHQHAQTPEDVRGALLSGVAAAALVCERHGAHPPTRDELEAFLQRA